MRLQETFGANLRLLREAKGLSQSDVGRQSYVADVEAGRKGLTFRQAEEFAARLRCSPLDFFREVER